MTKRWRAGALDLSDVSDKSHKALINKVPEAGVEPYPVHIPDYSSRPCVQFASEKSLCGSADESGVTLFLSAFVCA
jgi:hypothetical protein